MSLHTEDPAPSDQLGRSSPPFHTAAPACPDQLGLWAGPDLLGRSIVTFHMDEPWRPADGAGAP
jgi:hypothetical protein